MGWWEGGGGGGGTVERKHVRYRHSYGRTQTNASRINLHMYVTKCVCTLDSGPLVVIGIVGGNGEGGIAGKICGGTN